MEQEDRESRYARHHLIDWWDQERLRRACVMVAGAGAIGNEVIKLLALLGVGHILIVDFDTVEFSNLTRSVLFREEDIGRPKAEVAAERARQINPEITILARTADLEFDIGLGVYRAMDIVIGCLDSLQARLALNRLCLRADIPWLNGGIETTLAEVALYGSGSGACFECGMTDTMWARYNRRTSCGGLLNEIPEEKMPTTAIVASLIAGYLVNEALLLIHAGSPETKEGLALSQKLYLTIKPYSFGVFDLPRNPECLAHDRWEPIQILSESPRDLSAVDLIKLSGSPEAVVELGFDLLTEMRCIACGSTEFLFKATEQCSIALTRCPACNAESRQPEIIHRVDADSELAYLPLVELGIPDYQTLRVRNGEETRYFQLSGNYSFNSIFS